MSDLKTLAVEKCRSSGLTDAQVKRLNLNRIMSKEEMKKLGLLGAGALVIPYWSPEGKPIAFCRYRYLERAEGFAGNAKKAQRYAQKPGTLNQVYLPPLLSKPWSAMLADPSVPVVITEGEFKAAKACAEGFPTVGLGGVRMFRAAKRDLPELLPGLQDIDWNGRDVTIMYDSDAATNPEVLKAELDLAKVLVARGAEVRIGALPPTKEGDKQGLDDFLVNEGAEALTTLLDSSDVLRFDEGTKLWALNEEVIFIRDQAVVVEVASGMRMKPSTFKESTFANRHYQEVTPLASGGTKNVTKPLAPRWLEWAARNEAPTILYSPGEPRITESRAWNTWSGWGVEPKKGDVSLWRWLLDLVFQDAKPESRVWFERWLAYPLQYPGTKLFTASVLWGRIHGTGKTLVGHSMMRIYGDNTLEIHDQELQSAFNGWAENKQFIVGDEVTGSDKREQANKLKGYITSPSISINVKFLPQYSVRDRINYLFTSNQPDAFFLEDTDRRFFIHEVTCSPATPERYRLYDRWYKGDGASALFHYLLHLDLGDFNPTGSAFETGAKKAMLTDSKSDVGMFCVALKEDPEGVLAQSSVITPRASKECPVFTPEQLLSSYNGGTENPGRVTANGLARELKRAGFRQVNEGSPVRTGAGLKRLYAVRDVEQWASASHSLVAAEWNKFFAQGANAKRF